VLRDRSGALQSELLKLNSNEIEDKEIAIYAMGNSTKDIRNILQELCRINVSPDTISKISDKVWPLADVYAILDSCFAKYSSFLS